MNVFDLYARIKLDSSDYRLGLSEAGATAVAFTKSAIGEFEKLAATALDVGKRIAGAFTDLTKSALSEYGNYEQLAGGIKTLFGESAQQVIANAEKAFTTAGMSMNDYMDTTIQFSASLIQGLEGDTVKAAEYVDKAITDMSDNVNKMGTSTIMVQNAYRGLARQNFQMLDNLALGYQGNAAEMARLINDSKVLGDTFVATAENVKEISFDKYIEAIHIVQQEMGITGTTAEEAAGTIQGSTASMSAAWKNLVTELGKSNGDIKKYLDNFIGTFQANLSNIVPRIGQIAHGIGDLIKEAAPILAEELPPILKEVLPVLFESIATIVKSISDIMPQLAPTLVDIGITIFDMMFRGISEKSGDESNGSFIEEFIKALKPKLPYIKFFGSEMIENITSGINAKISDFLDKGGEIVSNLVAGLTERAPDIGKSAISLITQLGTKITDAEGIAELLNAAKGIIDGLINGLTSQDAMDMLTNEETGLPKIVTNIINAITDGTIDLLDLAKTIIKNVVGYFMHEDNVAKIQAGSDDILVALGEGFTGIVHHIHEDIVDLMSDLAVEMVDDFDADDTALDLLIKLGQAIANKIASGFKIVNPTMLVDSLLHGRDMAVGYLEDAGDYVTKDEWDAAMSTGTGFDFMPSIANYKKGSEEYYRALYDLDKSTNKTFENWMQDYYLRQAADPSGNMESYIFKYGVKGVPVFGDGGIVTKPTLAMIGDDGAEAVVPLEKESETGRMFGGISISFGNIYVQGGENAGNEVIRQIDEALRIWQIQQSRGIGGTAWQT